MHAPSPRGAPYAPPSSDTHEVVTRRPRAWIAVALGLLAPGAGHVYAGAGWRSLRAVALAILGLFATSLVLSQPIVVGILGVSVFVLVAVDAARLAGREDAATPPRGIVIASAVALIALLGSVQLAARSSVYEAYAVPAASMAPALLTGDRFLLDRLVYRSALPQRGDVVAFLYPDDRRVTYVKRVIGLPGDVIEILGDELVLNGVPIERTLLEAEAQTSGATRSRDIVSEMLPNGRTYRVLEESVAGLVGLPQQNASSLWVVPEGHYFMLGDNRDNSRDSRRWRQPYVPIEDVRGRVVSIYFSRDPETGTIRWDRVGPFEPEAQPSSTGDGEPPRSGT